MAVQRHTTGSGSLRPCPERWCRASGAGSEFLSDVLAGLRRAQKTLPCKYFYDQVGSELFDAICQTPEYYPTRTELAIMRTHIAAMAKRLGPGCLVIEYGSGSSLKTRVLLRELARPTAYIPVDISSGYLYQTAAGLVRRFPDVEVKPVAADFTRPFIIPAVATSIRRRIIYFPGSTIGNLTPQEARELLRAIARQVGSGGGLLIGVDLKKDPAILHAAYNDAAGVTAAFNLNLLARIQRELGARLNLAGFRHRAFYQQSEGRVEMHLESLDEQIIQIGEHIFPFRRGETIHTENSHKYTIAEFACLAARVGFHLVEFWTDPEQLFSVHYYELDSINVE
jgi:L-histidine N-alpha-methyltransferase